jgi:sterol desaturase/sphingolipid hydroxylase (fatty acid hydroxylase superfamily)
MSDYGLPFLASVLLLWPVVQLVLSLPIFARSAIVACAPTIAFWVTASSLHLAGANNGYKGRVKVRDMIKSQLCVDTVQLVFTVPRFFMEEPGNIFTLRIEKLVLGIILIDVIEYSTHRFLHEGPLFLRQMHKKHHTLIPLHTFGSYYNSLADVLSVGACLGVATTVMAGLSCMEIAYVSTVGTICTVVDHCPSSFWGATEPSHHEVHHNVDTKANYSQPFTPFLDWLFGTLHDEGRMKQRLQKTAAIVQMAGVASS